MFGKIAKILITVILCFSGAAQAGLNDGLVAYYPFNGNANDESGNGNHGKSVGGVSYIPGKFGQAASFDGIDDYIKVPMNNNLSQYGSSSLSVSTWVNIKSPCYGVVTARPFWILHWSSCDLTTPEGMHFYVGNNNTWANVKSNISVSEGWHHWVGVYNGNSLSIYLDGALNNSIKLFGNIDSANGDGDPNWIIFGKDYSPSFVSNGYYVDGNSSYFPGDRYNEVLLDDIRIYNRAVSDSEIQELYNEGSTPNREEATRYIPATETLHLPRVEVGMQQYSARLKLTDAENSLNFKLVEAVPIESAGLNNASFAGSLLKIPMVKVPNRAGFDAYNANLTLIPDASPIEFKLNNADLISSDYSEHAVSLASAVIESYMKNAKDTIVSFRVEGGAIKYTLFRYKAATQELVNGSIQVLASGAFASMETYGGCKNDVTSLKCVKTVEKILASTLTGLGAGIICSPAGPYAAVACSSGASILTKLALDKAYELAFDSGIFIHKAVVVVSDQATEVYDFGVSVYRSDIGGYLDWVAICLSDIRRNCRY